jgi:hypothetical protein
MPPRHFTRDEVDALLIEIRPLTEKLVAHRAALVEAQRQRAELGHQIAGNGGGVDPSELGRLEELMDGELAGVARCVNAIHGLGGVVKDPDTGLVDFPARIEGVEAFLCWQLGEEQVDYWHGIEEGFAGRKPLDS